MPAHWNQPNPTSRIPPNQSSSSAWRPRNQKRPITPFHPTTTPLPGLPSLPNPSFYSKLATFPISSEIANLVWSAALVCFALVSDLGLVSFRFLSFACSTTAESEFLPTNLDAYAYASASPFLSPPPEQRNSRALFPPIHTISISVSFLGFNSKTDNLIFGFNNTGGRRHATALPRAKNESYRRNMVLSATAVTPTTHTYTAVKRQKQGQGRTPSSAPARAGTQLARDRPLAPSPLR